ncbi:CaiB/BaiF CoA transferase family protein [Candidatus Viadribacter manganicus]|uniref:Carnitine dehydratase n=1 Tax=Candidatus Viadribacter manganicus TaxID=1759059 RepID=A0A1B1AE59_9PROT|nr:CaiB/BaiF CoA-transferase family protein [Candidatus Viadribacter manganicus]ANP44832.1 carnitine dehydratase [Candidatus Viadribacter manganicus]
MSSGPLAGVRVLEFASIGPGPFCAMLLSDMGADVIRIDRPSGVAGTGPNAVLQRGRPSLVLDLKQQQDQTFAARAAASADVLIEGNRPGVMERLGLGPAPLMAANPALIYARMTGYGQTGPRAQEAGHDINYLAMTGALDAIGDGVSPPRAPLNLLADFGGGALYLAFGIVSALYERTRSDQGQIIDAAIIDGAASLMGMMVGATRTGSLAREPNANILSGGAPFYRTYRCADGRYIAIGAIEPQFYTRFIEAMELQAFAHHKQRDPGHWPQMCAALEKKFATRPLEDWLHQLAPLDACINAVLSMEAAFTDPHLTARQVFIDVDGAPQPAPAPRLSRTPGAIQGAMAKPGEGGRDALKRWGVS